MKRLVLIRHGQASFGADDYDVLSKTGHRQANALGAALRRQGLIPDAIWRGEMRRHRETLDGIRAGMALDLPEQVHPGLNEFDFQGLLRARFARGDMPEGLMSDRRTHFTTLRDTVLMWAQGEIDGAPESWTAFSDRVQAARNAISAEGGTAFAVSSGGAIARMVSMALKAPPPAMIALQLQMKNAAMSILIGGGLSLHSFNETPFLSGPDDPLLTYA